VVEQIGENGAVLVRPRLDDDLPGCGDVLRQVHRLDGYPRHLPGELMEFLDTPDTHAAWVAEVDGVLVGHVALVASSSQTVMDIATAALGLPAASLGVVARLFVAAQARRGGTGAALLEAAVDAGWARGAVSGA
jgi:GNAT superfamily N-acetyltransferase